MITMIDKDESKTKLKSKPKRVLRYDILVNDGKGWEVVGSEYSWGNAIKLLENYKRKIIKYGSRIRIKKVYEYNK